MTFCETSQIAGADIRTGSDEPHSKGNNLTETDYRNFAASFITPEIICDARIRRVGDMEGAELVGRTRKAGVSYEGIIFTYFNPKDNSARAYRLRRDLPDKEFQEDGTIKEKGK